MAKAAPVLVRVQVFVDRSSSSTVSNDSAVFVPDFNCHILQFSSFSVLPGMQQRFVQTAASREA